ncbi:hypothetical protein CUMW_104590 [Citrus unshiu]|uniref:Uncharacterized protein n=1 Tax=Citrus unshiu TaxID=55188 RepID=A0A2H5P506_CITUN|nr:hypothetical protein CUMW_104590 [Citrus unshiu]
MIQRLSLCICTYSFQDQKQQVKHRQSLGQPQFRGQFSSYLRRSQRLLLLKKKQQSQQPRQQEKKQNQNKRQQVVVPPQSQRRT